MRIYCIYDTVAEESGPLFEARNDAIARRIFDNLKELPPGSDKSDFRLYALGFIEKEKPCILAHSKARRIDNVASNDEPPTPPAGWYDAGDAHEALL